MWNYFFQAQVFASYFEKKFLISDNLLDRYIIMNILNRKQGLEFEYVSKKY